MPLQGMPTDEPKFFELGKFEGMNTKAARPGIEDQQFSWCENFFPIGANNLRTMPGKGATLYTATGGKTIVYHYPYNLGSTPYQFVCLSDGTAVQVNINTGAVTTISAVANRFYSGTNLPQAAQWGNQYLLIVSSTGTNGSFIWDGTTLYTSGSIGPYAPADLLSGGTGYTSAPTVAITGGGGSGATATATITAGSVTALTVTNPGTGFTSEPLVIFTGGGSTGGSLVQLIVINAGSNYTSAPTVAFSGGGGTAAAATATVGGGIVTGFTITTAGSGYTGQPTVTLTGGGGTGAVALAVIGNVAAARLPIMPSGVSGTCIETFQGRVWTGNGSIITFTAPNSTNNTATSAGGGTFPSTDSNLRVSWNRIVNSNGFLYLFGDSSVSVISNVQTSGSPTTTTFNVAGIDPQIGTPWRDSVAVFGRAIVFGTVSGIYACYGGSVDKVSEMLDGLFLGATLTTSGPMVSFNSAAVANIFNIKTYMMLLTITDPFTGVARPVLVMWDGRKWFVGSQESTLTFLSTQEFNGNLTAWGTDGTNLFPLFQTASAALNKKVQGKLWAGDGMVIYKRVIRLYSDIVNNSSVATPVTISIDSEVTGATATITASQSIIFVNNLGAMIQLRNNTPANITFTVPGLGVAGVDANAYGKLLGFTISTSNPDVSIINAVMLYENLTPFG